MISVVQIGVSFLKSHSLPNDIGLFNAESGFFDGNNLDFWRIEIGVYAKYVELSTKITNEEAKRCVRT